MKYTTLLLFVIVAMVSCKKKHPAYPSKVMAVETKYHSYTKIDTTRNYNGNIHYNETDGNGTVFSYNNMDVSGHFDEPSGTRLCFQVDSGISSFSYSSEELQKHLTYFQQYGGFAGIYSEYAITSGTISGYKDSYRWQITINIELPVQDYYTKTNSINTTATFTPEFVD